MRMPWFRSKTDLTLLHLQLLSKDNDIDEHKQSPSPNGLKFWKIGNTEKVKKKEKTTALFSPDDCIVFKDCFPPHPDSIQKQSSAQIFVL